MKKMTAQHTLVLRLVLALGTLASFLLASGAGGKWL